ncbi:protein phosphatase regulator [Malassezia vespertilionis]|uniref:protein phosphatase regulator n=1 Tax=Malassezia vespertilionis TaxID=2020962 RepID=UPI0024B0B3CD|nr:protein phosphatase regulator [Malassezia vespertilionis]WFD07898.1 protein phosphatase regulator [Malassezia vespertilionis]
MLSAPEPYPTVSNSTPAPDDAQIVSKMPEICVDYLSHEWKDEDVWNSWKAMTKKKNEISNGVRLENASWRTWAKQRGRLKTISPETLNWLKESDVTWLYGPLHGPTNSVPAPKVATTAERLGIEEPSCIAGKKSILKHRTLSEVLRTPRNISPEEDIDEQFMRDAGGLSPPPALRTSLRRIELLEQESDTPNTPEKPKRHISFNHRVEQCVALEHPSGTDSYYGGAYDEYSDEDDYSDTDSYSDSATQQDSVMSGQSHHSSSSSEQRPTIAILSPTELKTPHEYLLDQAPALNSSRFTDSDDDMYADDDMRYSMVDPVSVTQDLPLDQDDYDYSASDEEYDASNHLQSVSNSACQRHPTDADTHVLGTAHYEQGADERVSGSSLRGQSSQQFLQDRPSESWSPRSTIPPHTFDETESDALVVDVENLPRYSLAEERVQHSRGLQDDSASPRSQKQRTTSLNTSTHDVPSTQALPNTLSDPTMLFVDEDEGYPSGLISSAVEIINTARDLAGTLLGTEPLGSHTWYE